MVSDEGRFLAHSSPDRAGRRREIPSGEVARWGEVQRTRFINERSQILREYQTPVRRRDDASATVLIAVPDTGVWGAVLAAAEHAPVAFICPMVLVILGAIILRRTVRPMSEIEKQLKSVATATSFLPNALHPLDVPSPVAIGWNRLTESLSNGHQEDHLDAKLSKVLEGYRQQKLDQILNSLPDGVAVTDERGCIKFSNKALAVLLGMRASNATLCGKRMEECLPLAAEGAPASQLVDPNLRKRPVVVEMGRGGDMSQGVLRVARSPLCSGQGEASEGHVWSVRDVTQQKLADQMRDQFVNAATHELRTPMANIKAYAETLALSEMMDVERQKEFCNTINEEVTRLARFVDDLLHLSHMEVGSTSLKQQVTDMGRLLRETIKKARPQMEQRRIAFDVKIPEKLPEFVACSRQGHLDKDKIAVALVNLLGNAAKYTPEDGRVCLHVEMTDGAMQIDVEDTGIGISLEELPKITEKFFRSSDPRVSDQTGSGLGLALTNEIVRLHGGKLTVHSELNKGSKFTIILPTSLRATQCSSA